MEKTSPLLESVFTTLTKLATTLKFLYFATHNTNMKNQAV